MKKLSLILILLFCACENLVDLEEQVSPLSGIFYVFEGWDKFMDADYDRAVELFSATLLADEDKPTNYYDYAYVGLGWTAIYKAKINQGIENKSLREELRSEAISHFNAADELMDIRIENVETTALTTADSLVYANIMAGKSYTFSYLALDKAMEYYTDGLDSLVWVDALELSKSVIHESDTLFLHFADYDFAYDENFNKENIHLIRAQNFIRLSDLNSETVNYLDSAAVEVEQIESLECDLTQLSVIQCLNTLDLLP